MIDGPFSGLGGLHEETCPRGWTLLHCPQEYGREKAGGYGQTKRNSLSLFCSHPPSVSPPSEGCQRRHYPDRGWDLKYIMDLIMEICGISSCMSQPPETTLCPDEHMCEVKDICPQLWGQEAAAGARLISKIKLWSLFIKFPIIRIAIKL